MVIMTMNRRIGDRDRNRNQGRRKEDRGEAIFTLCVVFFIPAIITFGMLLAWLDSVFKG